MTKFSGRYQGTSTLLVVGTVDVSQEQLVTWIVIRLEGNGTTNDVGIGLHNVATVGKHTVGLVKVPLKVLIDVIRGLLDRHQDIVNMLLCTHQSLLSIASGLVDQCLAREIDQRGQRQEKQQHHLPDDQQAQPDRQMGYLYPRNFQHKSIFIL